MNYFRKQNQAEEIIEHAIALQSKYKIEKVKLNQFYYYINHHFYIIKQQEKNSASDDKRFMNNNYFDRQEQAKIILASILEKRKIQLFNNL